MRAFEVRIGDIYGARVDQQRTVVQIQRVRRCGGWDAKNLVSGREVYIQSGHRLRLLTAEDRAILKTKARF